MRSIPYAALLLALLAIEALAAIGDPRSVDPLVNLLVRDIGKDVFTHDCVTVLGHALVRLKDPRAVEPLIPLVEKTPTAADVLRKSRRVQFMESPPGGWGRAAVHGTRAEAPGGVDMLHEVLARTYGIAEGKVRVRDVGPLAAPMPPEVD